MDVITYALCKGNGGGGSGGGVLVVTDTNGTLDKTWQEIFNAGFSVLKVADGEDAFRFYVLKAIGVYEEKGSIFYGVDYQAPGDVDSMDYVAISASDYPTLA